MNAELLRSAQAGDNDACEQAVRENSGLIWSIARRYFGRGVEADDLYQLGCLGFLKAVRGFDFAYGTCFSTYAVPKIAGEIRRYLRDSGSLKVSRSLREQALLLYRTRERLRQENGEEPTLSLLAEETGLTGKRSPERTLPAMSRNPCRRSLATASRWRGPWAVTPRRSVWWSASPWRRPLPVCRSGSG